MIGAAVAMAKSVVPTKVEDFWGKEMVGYASDLTIQDMSLSKKYADVKDERFLIVSCPYLTVAMLLTEGFPDAEAFRGKAVRFMLDETSFDGAYDLSVPLDDRELARPVSLEVAGGMAYGVVEAIDEKTVTLKLHADCDLGKAGESVSFPLDADTADYMGDMPFDTAIGNVHELFTVGISCELLYDAETMTALTMREMNG